MTVSFVATQMRMISIYFSKSVNKMTIFDSTCSAINFSSCFFVTFSADSRLVAMTMPTQVAPDMLFNKSFF